MIAPEPLHYLGELARYATICIVVIAIGLTIVASIAFLRADRDQAKSLSLLLQRGSVFQFLTVMTIVIGACLLAIIGKINSEGIIALLSGVAGYVLGSVSRGQRDVVWRTDKPRASDPE
jgi:Ca2+/Na+ antiporter